MDYNTGDLATINKNKYTYVGQGSLGDPQNTELIVVVLDYPPA